MLTTHYGLDMAMPRRLARESTAPTCSGDYNSPSRTQRTARSKQNNTQFTRKTNTRAHYSFGYFPHNQIHQFTFLRHVLYWWQAKFDNLNSYYRYQTDRRKREKQATIGRQTTHVYLKRRPMCELHLVLVGSSFPAFGCIVPSNVAALIGYRFSYYPL